MSYWKDDLIYNSEESDFELSEESDFELSEESDFELSEESDFELSEESDFESYDYQYYICVCHKKEECECQLSDEEEEMRMVKLFKKYEDYFPSIDEIRSYAKSSGLSFKTIISCVKRKEKLKLFLPEGKDPRVKDKNNPKYISNYSEEKMIKDAGRFQLNRYIISNPKEIISALKEDSLEQIMDKIEKQFRGKVCEASENYNSWFKICLNLKFLEDSEKGLEMFKRFSSLSTKYNEKECEKFWNSAEPSFGSIGIIISTVYANNKPKR